MAIRLQFALSPSSRLATDPNPERIQSPQVEFPTFHSGRRPAKEEIFKRKISSDHYYYCGDNLGARGFGCGRRSCAAVNVQVVVEELKVAAELRNFLRGRPVAPPPDPPKSICSAKAESLVLSRVLGTKTCTASPTDTELLDHTTGITSPGSKAAKQTKMTSVIHNSRSKQLQRG
eukprot:498387-Amphidinium_carterae.1